MCEIVEIRCYFHIPELWYIIFEYLWQSQTQIKIKINSVPWFSFLSFGEVHGCPIIQHDWGLNSVPLNRFFLPRKFTSTNAGFKKLQPDPMGIFLKSMSSLSTFLKRIYYIQLSLVFTVSDHCSKQLSCVTLYSAIGGESQ